MITNSINTEQNEANSIELLKASDAGYSYARRADAIRTLITVASVGGAVLAVIRVDLVDVLAAAGVAGVVLNELVRHLLTLRWTRQAMLFQEWLDTGLFGLKWNPSLGRKPREEDRRHWEKRFHGDESSKLDWYIDVSGLPEGHAILLCQRENLSWDARLRRIWGSALLIFATVLVMAGVVIGAREDWKVWELVVRWLVPAAPAVIFAVMSGLQHRRIADEKDDLINRVEDLLEDVPVRSKRGQKRIVSRAREFQDDIARLRAEQTRVPGWLYNWLRSAYEDEAASAGKRWRDKLLREMADVSNDDIGGKVK